MAPGDASLSLVWPTLAQLVIVRLSSVSSCADQTSRAAAFPLQTSLIILIHAHSRRFTDQ